jgi:hypothetical protein
MYATWRDLRHAVLIVLHFVIDIAFCSEQELSFSLGVHPFFALKYSAVIASLLDFKICYIFAIENNKRLIKVVLIIVFSLD